MAFHPHPKQLEHWSNMSSDQLRLELKKIERQISMFSKHRPRNRRAIKFIEDVLNKRQLAEELINPTIKSKRSFWKDDCSALEVQPLQG